jgi:hypothetical protein
MGKVIALSLLLALTACQTANKGSFCAISHPIRLSSQAIDALSDDEVAKLLAFNRKGAALCGWKA